VKDGRSVEKAVKNWRQIGSEGPSHWERSREPPSPMGLCPDTPRPESCDTSHG
jgi:hypothetical protein